VGYHKFRQNHGQGLIRMQGMHGINIGKERTYERVNDMKTPTAYRLRKTLAAI
jgi:hypothetical protein